MLKFQNDQLGLAGAVRKAIDYLGYIFPPGHHQAYGLMETASYCCGPYDPAREKGWYWKAKLALSNWLLAWQHRLNVEIIRSLKSETAMPGPGELRSQSRRPRLAFLVPYDVSENTMGGSARAWGLCRALARDCDVQLITVAGPRKRPEHRWIAPGFEMLVFPVSAGQVEEQKRRAADAGRAAQLLMLQDMALQTPYLDAFLAQVAAGYDALLLEGPFLYDLVKGCAPTIPLVYSLNDVTSEFLSRLMGRSVPAGVVARIQAQEQAIIQQAVGVLTVSESDAVVLRGMYPDVQNKLLLVPNGVEAESIIPHTPLMAARLAAEVGVRRRMILFVGSPLQANMDAVGFIAQALAPQFPQEQFVVMGVSADTFFDRYNKISLPENLVFTGALDAVEKEAVMALCQLAIAPMADGTGSSLKVPDYLAHGKPTVATSLALRGFEQLVDDVHLAELDTFSDALRNLLLKLESDPVGQEARASRISKLVRQQYDWKATTAPLRNCLTRRPGV